jgi:TPR repeat protein
MKQDIRELIKKVEQKDSKAMEKLGICYLKGIHGVTTDPTHAYKLFKESAELGNHNSLYNIAKIHLVDSYGIKDIPKGISLLKKAAKSKHTESIFELAKIYYYGKVKEKNMDEAENYLRKAANADDANPKAQYLLAYIWENGLLEDFVNIEEAFKYYEKSAESKYTDALFKCGLFHLNGIEDFLEVDISKSIEYLQMASDQGHFEANSLLAKVYLNESIRLLQETSKKSEDAMVVLNVLSKIDLDMLK